jgi:IS5 family transposase
VITAKVHDAALLDEVLPPEPGDVYGNSAFAGRNAERVIVAHGGRRCIVRTGTWGGPEALDRLIAHNAAVSHVRARIAKVFGTSKRGYGCLGCRVAIAIRNASKLSSWVQPTTRRENMSRMTAR